MEIQVVGAGSLGSLLAAFLDADGHEVHVVGRVRDVEAIRRDGVRVTGENEIHASPSADTRAVDADVSFVAVKSYDTGDAAELLDGKRGVAVSLQNGMGNEATLDEALDAEVLAGVCEVGARKVEPGVVEHAGGRSISLGAPEGGGSSAEEIAEALDGRLSFEARDDMPRVLWSKLAVNSALNPVTALTRLSNGEALERAGEVVETAARETADVARADDVSLARSDAVARVRSVARETASNRSSMLRDVERGRKTEVDSINGYVVRRAGRHDVDVPVNRALWRLVRAVEAPLTK
ncbi:MAG: ketopantoate reductase family protein [Halobacteriales archaeon]